MRRLKNRVAAAEHSVDQEADRYVGHSYPVGYPSLPDPAVLAEGPLLDQPYSRMALAVVADYVAAELHDLPVLA